MANDPSSTCWAWPARPDGWRSGRSRWAPPAGPARPGCCCWPATPPPTPAAGPPTSARPATSCGCSCPSPRRSWAAAGPQLLRHAGPHRRGLCRRRGGKAGRPGPGALRPRRPAAAEKADRLSSASGNSASTRKTCGGQAQALGRPARRPARGRPPKLQPSPAEAGRKKPGQPSAAPGGRAPAHPRPGPGGRAPDSGTIPKKRGGFLYDEKYPSPQGGQGL